MFNKDNKNKEEMQVILDLENKEQITVVLENGKEVVFEQVDIVSLEKKVYIILKAIDEIKGKRKDEKFVFEVVFPSDAEPFFREEKDVEAIKKVLEKHQGKK
ncbi:MAG: hypothetical protein ACOX24_05740 [Christensenellales bacterium]|jgi:uncharacterized protein YrzB (UPF0473 family)|nr:hypothetical protein [Clostridiales bacterium]